jgi:hypothetical protein
MTCRSGETILGVQPAMTFYDNNLEAAKEKHKSKLDILC